jgi:hypothetical protein
MTKTTCKVSCPFCGHGNKFNLNPYIPDDTGNYIGLKDKCENCGGSYWFDAEVNFLTVAFTDFYGEKQGMK